MEEHIINLYSKNKNISLISRETNKSQSFVRSILLRRNIVLRKGTFAGIDFPVNIKNEIAEKYVSGLSKNKLSRMYRVSHQVIGRIIKDKNINIRGQSKHVLDSSYFETIDSKLKAYFLGLIEADGCIIKNRNSDAEAGRFEISLQERDGYLIEKLCQEIKISKNPEIRDKGGNRQRQIRISFSDKIFCHHLSALGCKSNKSFSLKFPSKIPQKFISSFILGYFDGDGCISINKKKGVLSIACAPDFATVCRSEINKLAKTKGHLITRRCKNKKQILSVSYCGNYQILKIFNLLYSDSEFYLRRKYDKFLTLIHSNPQKYIPFLKSLNPKWAKLERNM